MRRKRTVVEPPGAIVARWCAATLVPTFAGFTLSRLPWTTKSLIPSLTYGDSLLLPGKSRSLFVSFSVKSSGTSPSQWSVYSPSRGWAAETALVPARAVTCASLGFTAWPAIQDDQSLRNQSVGRRWSSAASGPRFTAVIFTRMSSAPPLAYSTKTSK